MLAQAYAILPAVCNQYISCTYHNNALFSCKSHGASSCVSASTGKYATIVARRALHGRSPSEFA